MVVRAGPVGRRNYADVRPGVVVVVVMMMAHANSNLRDLRRVCRS